ncbi:MAG: diguanylate cyclase [Thermoanaerobaculum sp.]|nr:diguanylate cyclase [Thermoanaerobaculum sp.]MDW7967362.1 diguanylate cyclase [Thermoanaerobaculum sp.]
MKPTRVLVVDDSELARALVVRALSQAGYEVLQAADGAEAAVMAFRTLPQVVLTDLEMPTMDGNQLLRLLKSDPSTASIPVIILTSHNEAPSRFWGLATGADAYITKDASPQELVAEVHKLAQRSPTVTQPPGALPQGPLDVLARVAKTLDQALMKATLTSSLLAQGIGSSDWLTACRRVVRLLREVVDGEVFAVGVAEAHTVSMYVAAERQLSLATFDAVNKQVLDHLPLTPGAEVELTYDGEHNPERLLQGTGDLRFFPLPLREAEGVLAILPQDELTFRTVSEPLLSELTNPIALVLDNARLAQRLRELSSLDSLTRLLNHRAIFERLGEELARASRRGLEVSVILADLDHFKEINDTYGHLAGDAVLRAAAQLFRHLLRASDGLGRYGGEEFMVVLPETTLEAASHTAERLRQSLERQTVPLATGEKVSVTASFGVACASELVGPKNPDALVSLADMRLYQAKAAGRNCVKP